MADGRSERVAVLDWRGTLGRAGRPDERFDTLVEQGARVVFNLEGIGHIDSVGLGFLIYNMKRLQEMKGDLVLSAAPHHVRKAIETVHHRYPNPCP